MLQAKQITEQTKEIDRIRNLYWDSFPQEERIPLERLIHGEYDFCAVYDGDLFCGFFSLLTYRDISHITFFAVRKDLRDRGYGSQILRLIGERKPGCRIIADIEAVEEGAQNNRQRMRRKNFYLRNGYRETEIAYCWRGVDYQIVSQGGMVTEREFDAFWAHFDRAEPAEGEEAIRD